MSDPAPIPEHSDLRAALAFLTPFGGAVAPTPGALDWFPVVGAGLGAAVGSCWWLARRRWPSGVAAALAVAADLTFTGMLHFDGLVDSADGLLPPFSSPDRRLEVMSAPDVGAFGLGAGSVVVLLRWSALTALDPSPVLTAALWSLSRAIMAEVIRTQHYSRPNGGLAAAFLKIGQSTGRWGRRGVALAIPAGAAGFWNRRRAAVVLLGGSGAATAVVGLARRRIGGFTGDVLGAAGLAAETAGLVLACRVSK